MNPVARLPARGIFARVISRAPSTLVRPAIFALATLAGCSDGTGPDPTIQLLVVGVVRHDASPRGALEGGIAFFFDRDRERLLTADAVIVGPETWELSDSVNPGVVPGPIYHRAPRIRPGERWRLLATVFAPVRDIQIQSTEELVPAEFEVRAPAVHPAGQPLTVEWDPILDADRINVAAGSGFETEIDVGATSFTFPASAFQGIAPGTEIEIEVTAFNNFYVSIAGGISSLEKAEEFTERFLQNDNVDGASGVFGAATSMGVVVTIQ